MRSDVAPLLKLLVQPPVYCGVVNKYAEPEASSYFQMLGCTKIPGLPFACYIKPNTPSHAPLGSSTDNLLPNPSLPPSPQTKHRLLYYYAMDVASLYPVLSLDVGPSDTILDMCAAPGGKAFALLQTLQFGEMGGALALNDTSSGRIKRLQDVVNHCVGRDRKHSIRITKRKGEEWAEIERDVYDRVLVDAPCSSDRHNMESWMDKGTLHPESQKFGKLQHNLLLGAVHAVKNGGFVVYSTCTEASEENDEVISRTHDSARKLGIQIRAELPHLQQNFGAIFGTIHNKEFGTLIVPSHSMNIGPMYTSKLHISK